MRPLLLAFSAIALFVATAAGRDEAAWVRLEQVPAGTAWIGWQSGGQCLVPLPGGWSTEGREDLRLSIQLADGRVDELTPGTRLRAVGPAKARAWTGFVRGVHRAEALRLEFGTRRLDFPGGATFAADLESFGPGRQTLVSALIWARRTPLVLTHPDEIRLTVERIQVQAPSGEAAAPASLRLPALTPARTPERVESFGLWSPGQVSIEAGTSRLAASTEQPGWCRLNREMLRGAPPRLEAPRAEVSVRQASFRRARVGLRCRVTEPTGLLAQDLRLTIDGAPGVIAFAAADSPVGLERALQELNRRRSGPSGAGAEPLAGAIEEYLVPHWFGLWYDADAAREEVQQPPGLVRFTAAYRAAVRQSAPLLREALARQRSAPAVTLAEPEAFRAALDELVTALSHDDRRAVVWWSVYLSDLLTRLAGAPIYYWHPSGLLLGAAGEPGTVALARLDEVADPAGSELLDFFAGRARDGETVTELVYPRLAPDGELPFEVVVSAGRETPVGRYYAELVLSQGGATQSVPLTVQVRPSLARLAALTLAIALPLLLVLLLALRLLREPRRELLARRRLLRLIRDRLADWLRFREQHGAELAGDGDPLAALTEFERRHLFEALSPELFAVYLRVRPGPPAEQRAFLRQVDRHFAGKGLSPDV